MCAHLLAGSCVSCLACGQRRWTLLPVWRCETGILQAVLPASPVHSWISWHMQRYIRLCHTMISAQMGSKCAWLLLPEQHCSHDTPLTMTGDWHEIRCSLAGDPDAPALELQGCQALFLPASLGQGAKLQVKLQHVAPPPAWGMLR